MRTHGLPIRPVPGRVSCGWSFGVFTMWIDSPVLRELGWRTHFIQQLSLEDVENCRALRVSAVHRSHLDALGECGECRVVQGQSLPGTALSSVVTVGDWVLTESPGARIVRVLERSSSLSRRAAGSEAREQLIAANLDTLFVVSACDGDFNLSRLERYLALARAARIEAVVVLTKRDLCADPDSRLACAAEVCRDSTVLAMNATRRDEVLALTPWLAAGRTVAFVGSSGVGKSTLVNALHGAEVKRPGETRLHDGKVRHTPRARPLLVMPGGALLIDTPGMRELGVGAVEDGIAATFDDIHLIAQRCRFRDCRHDTEPGCAVLAAVSQGLLSARRLRSYLKLQREAAHAAAPRHERHAVERRFGRLCKDIQRRARRDKSGES